MRKRFSLQRRLDGCPIEQVPLNFECRDELIPVLAGLQYIFSQPELRATVTDLVAQDVNATTRTDIGREGFSYWEIVVLAAVRLGCNLNYDKLQDLAENHRALRGILGIGDWDEKTNFDWRRIRDTLCMLRPHTIEKINQAIVAAGQELHGEARGAVRADSFVVETDIHYPTESNLIWDGIRKIIPLCAALAGLLNVTGWRQAKHLKKRIKQTVRLISQISASKSPKTKEGLPAAYQQLLARTATLLARAKTLQIQAAERSAGVPGLAESQELQGWIELTEKVCDTARRRMLLGEKVPNSDKLFSLFETHTQLYRRGKAGQPNQFGRLILVFEDAAGFISHYHFMPRDSQDEDVIVEQTRRVQELHRGEIRQASFDRGFYSAENEARLLDVITLPCLPPKAPRQYAESLRNASLDYHRARQRHPGVESAIGALQSGNGMKRCRDRSELGMERYIGLAILGRNVHVLGKLLIANCQPDAAAAMTRRAAS